MQQTHKSSKKHCQEEIKKVGFKEVLRLNISFIVTLLFITLSFYIGGGLGIFLNVIAIICAFCTYFSINYYNRTLVYQIYLFAIAIILSIFVMTQNILVINLQLSDSYSQPNQEKIFLYNLINKNFSTYQYPDQNTTIRFPNVYQSVSNINGTVLYVGYKPDNLYYTFTSQGNNNIIADTVNRFKSNQNFRVLSVTNFTYQNKYPAVDIYLTKVMENSSMRVRLVTNNSQYYMLFTDDKKNYGQFFDSLQFENKSNSQLDAKKGCDGTKDYCNMIHSIVSVLAPENSD